MWPAARFIVRAMMNYRSSGGTQRVAIYGAGSAGVQLPQHCNAGGRYHPIAFIDDNESLQHNIVSGIEVFPPSQMTELVKDEALVSSCCMPSQSRRRRQEILKRLER